MTRTIAVDFDGVIHTYDKGWHDGTIYGELVPGAAETIRMLQRQDNALYVCTSRDVFDVASWLIARDIPAVTRQFVQFWSDTSTLLVTNQKLPALAFIDDRAIRFIDWPSALTELIGRYPQVKGD